MYYYSLLYIFNTALAYLFYYIGDIFSRIPIYWAYDVYQFAMRKSIEYDDISGKKVWKEIR